MARYLIDFDFSNTSGFEFVEADTAQDAVDCLYSYYPADDIKISGVFKEVKNYRKEKGYGNCKGTHI